MARDPNDVARAKLAAVVLCLPKRWLEWLLRTVGRVLNDVPRLRVPVADLDGDVVDADSDADSDSETRVVEGLGNSRVVDGGRDDGADRGAHVTSRRSARSKKAKTG